ncbi:hypothetical protein [Dyella sp. ASV21]|uniref:hypothetical protein n=1 Tax=Dyella sp. ASV21 TaxID=2795114 RepID=UPI0018ED5734|nr:hypothetical protein [Dyella sp. ASV21]
MSSVIEFLERLGADAQLRYASQEELVAALEAAQVNAELGAAIIAKSTAELYALLDQQPMFHTQNNPGREDEEEDDEGEDEEEKPSSRNAVPRVSAHA